MQLQANHHPTVAPGVWALDRTFQKSRCCLPAPSYGPHHSCNMNGKRWVVMATQNGVPSQLQMQLGDHLSFVNYPCLLRTLSTRARDTRARTKKPTKEPTPPLDACGYQILGGADCAVQRPGPSLPVNSLRHSSMDARSSSAGEKRGLAHREQQSKWCGCWPVGK